MFDNHNNFGYSVVLDVVSQSAGILVFHVRNADASLFSINQNVTIWPVPPAMPLYSNAMIVRITGITGNQITASYPASGESSPTITVSAGMQVMSGVTAAYLVQLESAINTLTGRMPSGNVVGDTDIQTLLSKTLGSGSKITLGSDAQGDVWFRSSTGTIKRLAPGTAGQVLQTNGASADPSWVTPGGIYCSLYTNAAQSIPNNTATPVAFDMEEEDAANMHDNVTNNPRIVAPVSGLYLFNWKILFAGVNTTGRRAANLRLNGTTAIKGANNETQLATNGQMAAFGSRIVRMAQNDYMEVLAYQTSGGNLGIGSVAAGSPNEDLCIFTALKVG